MNSLLHRDGDDDLDEGTGHRDREITLGTTTILGLFFSLAVLCAVFFGFGYSVGHRSAPVTASVAPGEGQAGNAFSAFKPAAGNPVGSPGDKSAVQPGNQSVTVPLDTSAQPVVRPKPAPATPDEQAGDGAAPEVAPAPTPVTRPVPAAAAPVAPPVPVPIAIAGTSGAIVQVAAVSHQEDADLLVTTLKRRGYAVFVRNESQDKLLHVQLGPYSSHKDAEAIRQRLLNDGFNAMVKDSK